LRAAEPPLGERSPKAQFTAKTVSAENGRDYAGNGKRERNP
tara:strand:- start:909 stop:1031 length:123 start_codon:yes stop_codon:yes gene_type:complete